MRGFILEQVKLGMSLFSAQSEAKREQRLLSTKLVCVWYIYIYMYLGEEKGGVLVSRMFTRTIEAIRGAFMACSKFNSDMINIAALHPPTHEHV